VSHLPRVVPLPLASTDQTIRRVKGRRVARGMMTLCLYTPIRILTWSQVKV